MPGQSWGCPLTAGTVDMDIHALLRLKRYENPGEEYFEALCKQIQIRIGMEERADSLRTYASGGEGSPLADSPVRTARIGMAAAAAFGAIVISSPTSDAGFPGNADHSPRPSQGREGSPEIVLG